MQTYTNQTISAGFVASVCEITEVDNANFPHVPPQTLVKDYEVPYNNLK